MRYVALLRGINVGGNRKVDMKLLKATFERLGLQDVRTYINSGNVIFRDETHTPEQLSGAIEAGIEADFGFPVMTLVRDANSIAGLAATLPDDWADGREYKCDVMFLGTAIDRPDLLGELTIKPEFDEVVYAPGALLWRVPRSRVTRSGLMKLVGTKHYANMTVRNCNTLRKLDALMRE